MTNIPLLVLSIIIPPLCLISNIFFLAVFLDPQERKKDWFGKVLIIVGLLVSECTILLLPFDVGNKSGAVGCDAWNESCGNFNAKILWDIMFALILVLSLVVFPWYIFYYETYEPEFVSYDSVSQRVSKSGQSASGETTSEGPIAQPRRIRNRKGRSNRKQAMLTASLYTFFILVGVLVVTLPLFFTVSTASIPTSQTEVDISLWASSGSPVSTTCAGGNACPCGTGDCIFANSSVKIQTSFLVYFSALVTFLGWIPFSFYLGIGLVVVPIGAINAFRYRPKLMTAKEIKYARQSIADRTNDALLISENIAAAVLIRHEQADSLSAKELKEFEVYEKQEMQRLQVMTHSIEKDLDTLAVSDPKSYYTIYNPVVPYLKLLGGIVALVVSLLLIIHMIVYMIVKPPLIPFLNSILLALDDVFPLGSTILFTGFVVYLIISVGKGLQKFGTRFFVISIHPLERGKTMMNSFVFNVGLALFCTLPALHFSLMAFSGYTRLTDATIIIGNQFTRLPGMKELYRYNIFLFLILLMALVSVIYFSFFPNDREHLRKEMERARDRSVTKRTQLERKLAYHGGSLMEMGRKSKKGIPMPPSYLSSRTRSSRFSLESLRMANANELDSGQGKGEAHFDQQSGVDTLEDYASPSNKKSRRSRRARDRIWLDSRADDKDARGDQTDDGRGHSGSIFRTIHSTNQSNETLLARANTGREAEYAFESDESDHHEVMTPGSIDHQRIDILQQDRVHL